MMKYEEIISPTNEILDQYGTMKLTVRQIFYRLISPPYQLFAGTQNNYKAFDKQLTKARERGDVDWRRIEDRARTTIGGDYGYESVDDYLNDQIKSLKGCWEYFTRRLWDNQPYYCEVWVEKDALSALFGNVAKGFRVLTFPSRGYSSFTKIMEALTDENRFPRYIKMGKPILILHFTDHDPSGLNMAVDIDKRLYARKYLVRALRETFTNEELDAIKEAYKDAKENVLVRIVRCALTYDQVKQFDLAPNPTKRADPRRAWYVRQYGDECWELDALPPEELERIIRESIATYIDADEWEKDVEQIEKDKKTLKEKLEKVKITYED